MLIVSFHASQNKMTDFMTLARGYQTTYPYQLPIKDVWQNWLEFVSKYSY